MTLDLTNAALLLDAVVAFVTDNPIISTIVSTIAIVSGMGFVARIAKRSAKFG